MRPQLFILNLLVTLLISGCHHKKHSAPATPPMKIEVAQVAADSVALHYEFVTHLKSGNQTTIQPRVSGFLLQSKLQTSRKVKRGELLFVIDANELNTSLRSAEAQLRSAQAQAQEAESNYLRALPLAEINAISQTQMQQYKTAFLSAQQSVKAAREQVEDVRLQVGYARIYAPISGIAAAATAEVGDLVGVGTQFSSLTTISNMDSLKAELSLPTAIYLRVEREKRSINDNEGLLSNIRLYLTNGEEYGYAGSYDYTRQNISPTAGTITLVVLFPNPEYQLKAGEYARVECDLGEPVWRVLVPQQAVKSIQGVTSVWVVDADNQVHYRKVKIGGSRAEDYIVEDGLKSGEVVALTGSQKLRDGMKVVPIKNK